MLIGRETEMAGLGRLLDAAREGTSGALLLRGEAGIGKTALLEHAATAASGFRILRATGIESEAELPYATLHQLLRPLEGRIDQLAEPQARALRGALGLADANAADRFLVGVGTLTLLADAAEEQPLLALLDDAAWFDRASLDALGFVARRLEAEGIVLLFSVRDDPLRTFSLPGVEEMRVQRLAEGDAQALLGDGLDATRREQVIAMAGGNPLALLELGREGSADGGTEHAFASRVHGLPEATQTLLVLAAADSTTSLAVVGAAGATLGLDASALEPAENAGLVHAADGTLAFRHPLVRSAVYHSASFAVRARAHTALAAALEGEENTDRRAWHNAAAVLGTDTEAAAALERTADRARARGGYAAASAALERAGELSPDGDDRARRLVAAAQAARMAGDGDRSIAIVDRLGAVTDPALVAAIALTRGWMATDRTGPLEAFEWFLEAVRAGRHAAPEVAVQAAIRATEVAAQARVPERLTELRELLRDITVSGDDNRSALAVAEGFTAWGAQDFDATFPALSRAVELAEGSDDPLTLLHGAWAAAYSSDLVHAIQFAMRGERLARASGALAALATLLISRASWEVGAARFAAGETAAAEVLELTKETHQQGLAAIALALLAHVDAVRGREELCRQHAAEAIAIADARGESQPRSAAELALAVLDIGQGRSADALTRLQGVYADGHATYRYTVIDDLIEAATSAGKPDEALDALAAWQKWTRHSNLSIGGVVLARARALLAGPEDADARFQEALAAHEQLPWPFVHARTELAYGQFLRRARRRTEARVQLRSAYERFEAVGATLWADRAAGELRATGETARKRDASTLDQLTPQELQIARLAAEGGRNREIASRLFLSPKTVEYHLRKVFQKLEITSRTELARLVSSGSELVVAAP